MSILLLYMRKQGIFTNQKPLVQTCVVRLLRHELLVRMRGKLKIIEAVEMNFSHFLITCKTYKRIKEQNNTEDTKVNM